MSDRSHSTLICAAGDQAIFAGMGYKPETAQALTFDGEEIPQCNDDGGSGGRQRELRCPD